MWVPRKTKQEWKEDKKAHKAPSNSWQEAVVDPADYTVSKNQTIPTIKEHQSKEKDEEKH